MILIRRIFFLIGSLHHFVNAGVVPAPVPITRLADIRQLHGEVAAKAIPVSVTGVVTWCSPGRLSGGFMIDQDGAGISVIADIDLPDGRKCPGPEAVRSLTAGDKVEVTGVTRAGGYAPSILAAEIRKVGKAAIPEGMDTGLGSLLTGNYDAKRVSLKGVVTGCRPSDYGDGSWVMVLAVTSGKARAVVPALPGMRPEDMEDAGVLIRGVVFTRCNSRQEFVGVSVETNNFEDMEITTRGGLDPFGVQLLEAGQLRAKKFRQNLRMAGVNSM